MNYLIINEVMNYKCACKTAPAEPSLLKKVYSNYLLIVTQFTCLNSVGASSVKRLIFFFIFSSVIRKLIVPLQLWPVKVDI